MAEGRRGVFPDWPDALEKNLPLPGEIPASEKWPALMGQKIKDVKDQKHLLKVSLDDDAFLIETAGGIQIETPGYYMARWWVNGKPVEAKIADGIQQMQNAMKLEIRKDERVALSLPHSLGDLKAGDTVGLQVMYCVDGVRAWTKDSMMMLHMMRPEGPRMSMLSDKFEFKITDNLLKKAGDRKVSKERPAQKGDEK
jgi:hypothetical protein